MRAYLRKIKDTVPLKDALSVFIDNISGDYRMFLALMAPHAASMHATSNDAMQPPYTQLTWFMDYFANTVAPIKAALESPHMPDQMFLTIVAPSLKKLKIGKEQFPHMLVQLAETAEAMRTDQWGAVDTTAIMKATEHLRAIKMQVSHLLEHPVAERMLSASRAIER